jgi:hypothetical protein
MASAPPAAPSMWPVMDLVELTAIRYARSPRARLTARVSAASPAGVEVPWALMYWIWSGLTPASSIARRMHSAAPAPSSEGDVM